MRNKVQAAMTPDRIRVSLERFLLIEPDSRHQQTIISRHRPEHNNDKTV